MSGYAAVASTYTTSSQKDMASAPLSTTLQRIIPQGEYQVSVHPSPFHYYSLQHGMGPTNAYFSILTAYNGTCSTPAFRACTGDQVTETLPPQ